MNGSEVVVLQIVVPLLVAAIVGLMGWMLKVFRDDQKAQGRKVEHIEERHDKAIERLSDKVQDMAESLPVEYVRREEFIRLAVTMDRKLDALTELVDKRFNALNDTLCKGGLCERRG